MAQPEQAINTIIKVRIKDLNNLNEISGLAISTDLLNIIKIQLNVVIFNIFISIINISLWKDKIILRADRHSLSLL